MKAINKLSEISNIPKDEIKNIWLKVVENNKRLNACEVHNFNIRIGKKYQCSNCHGTIDIIHKKWYELGLKHATCFTIKIAKCGEK